MLLGAPGIATRSKDDGRQPFLLRLVAQGTAGRSVRWRHGQVARWWSCGPLALLNTVWGLLPGQYGFVFF